VEVERAFSDCARSGAKVMPVSPIARAIVGRKVPLLATVLSLGIRWLN
jgi:hypothetical protein